MIKDISLQVGRNIGVSNILITGYGFIGKKLTTKLKSLGHNVITVDRNDGADYKFDISKYDNFKQIEEIPFDIIYHTAGQSYGYRSLVEPELDVDFNVKGTLNICSFAKKYSVKKIIYTSTMAVYGDGDFLTENAPIKPLSNYGTSKYCGEVYIRQFSQFDIDYTIFRVFNTYGIGQNLDTKMQGVVAVFLSQILKGNEINVTGSLKRYRDLTYIDDTVDALILGLDDRTKNETYNICSMKKITIDSIIKKLIKFSGKNYDEFDIKNIGSHDGDNFGSIGSNVKLTNLGWFPKIKIEDGVRLFSDWARGYNVK